MSWEGQTTPTDKIVYNYLLSKSISTCAEIFNKDGGSINMEAVEIYLDSSRNKIDLYLISYRKVAKNLGISLASAYNSIKHLKSIGRVGDNWIYCNIEIIKGGYFSLRMDLTEEINGKLLVFYSWLCDRSKNGYVDAYRGVMARFFNDKESNIHNMLQRLHGINYISREVKEDGCYGKLKLLK